MKNIAIVGGGLVGSLMSIYLAKRGLDVTVYEKRSDARFGEQVGGRSINLALSNRGWKALEHVGVADQIKDMVIPMKGRMIHNLDGSLAFQAYGKEDEAIFSISRGGLNNVLDNYSIALPNVDYLYDMELLNADIRKGKLHFKNRKTDEKLEISPDIIFGADGAFSKVRAAMQKRKRFNYEQSFLEHGYKELSIPAGPGGSWQIEKNALHIWPRRSFMLIALPNLDGSFTVTLFLAFEGEDSFENLKSEQDVMAFFEKEFPDTIELMPDLVKDFFENPTDALVTIKCSPWTYDDKFILVGDASHAIVPFYGQGMNSGFEDCKVFDEVLGKYFVEGEMNVPAIFKEFQELRKEDGDAIAELALKNFIEMRDSVADEKFLVRKKIEKYLQKKYPALFIPTYSLVTFTEDIRYSEALRRGKIQDELFSDFMKIEGVVEKWESGELEEELEELVRAYQVRVL